MKLKKAIAGVLALAMVLTSVSADPFNAVAAEDYGIEDTLPEDGAEESPALEEKTDAVDLAEEAELAAENEAELSQIAVNAEINADESEWQFGTYTDSGTTYATLTRYTGSSSTIIIPDTVTGTDGKTYTVGALGKNLFEGNTTIQSVTVSDNLLEINNNAFKNCTNLSEVKISSKSKLKYMGGHVFENCDKLTYIYIPKTLTTAWTLGSGSPFEQSHIKQAELQNGITGIPEGLFLNASELETVNIPVTATYIGYQAFRNCTSLKSITVSNGVQTIDSTAFNGCTALEEVNLGIAVTSIGKAAFQNCTSLTKVTLPKQLQSLGDGAFKDSGLTYVFIPKSLGDFVITMSHDYAMTYTDTPFQNVSLTTIEFEEGITSIPAIMFAKSKIKSVVIPDTVESIGVGAFERCYELETVKMSASLKIVDEYAFRNCDALKSVSFPASLTGINGNAFSDNDELETVTFTKGSQAYIGNYAFRNCTNLTKLNLAEGVTSIGKDAFLNCDSLLEVDITKGVTKIGQGAFADCDSLKKVTMSDTVTTVGDSAFYLCGELTEVEFGKLVSVIDKYAFMSCPSLESVTIPANVEEICKEAFANNPSLTKVTIYQGVKKIADDAFTAAYAPLMTIYGITGSYAETFANGKNITFIPINSEEIFDKESGISVEGLLYPVTTLVVDVKASTSTSVTFDISVQNRKGETVQPENKVKVKIPVPQGWDVTKCRVVRVEANGARTDMNAVVQNGYFVFTTDHFSEYIIGQVPDAMLGDLNKDNKVTIADARMLLQAASGSRTLTADQQAVADINDDGKVNITDARWLLQVASGSRTL